MPQSLDAVDMVDLDDQAELLAQYQEARAAVAHWEERAEDLRHHLLNVMGQAKAGYVGGALVVRRAHVEPERLDKVALLKAYPDARRFYTPGTPYDRIWFPKANADE
jgi:hypothetical protein